MRSRWDPSHNWAVGSLNATVPPSIRPFCRQVAGDLDYVSLSCHSDGMTEMRRWEQRMRAPQLMSRNLLGHPVSWAAEDSNRGVVLATLTGRTEVFAFNTKTEPAELTQITDRPQGTCVAAVSPDGLSVFWFDDRASDELGRWRREETSPSRSP